MNKAEIHHETIQSLRQYLLPVMKETFGDFCAVCHKHSEGYEIDHIRYNDKITMYDLQLLCFVCHRSKTLNSGEAYLSRTPHCATCRCYE